MKQDDPRNPRPSAAKPEKAAAPRANRKPIVVALLVVVAVGIALYLLLPSKKPKARPSAGIPVSVGVAKEGNVDIFLDAIGTVTPVYTAAVTSRVAGEVTQVLYKEGQMVKKGDLLAIIDPRPYQAALLQAQGQLARDQALLKNAKLDLVRYQNAYEQHAVPEQQLATQQALVEQDAGVVQLDEGNLAAAQVNVDYTQIRSPIDGRVGLRSIDPGNIVAADGTTPLATVTQLQPITVIFNISEDDLGPVAEQTKAGKSLLVEALDRSQLHKLADGTLLTLDNEINTATGTVRARAEFPNKDNELFPNQFVNARLRVKTLSNVILVPAAAIQRNSDETYVYVIQPDGTVRSRDVKVAATESETSAVSGVNSGEQLVTDGFDKLQSGTKVVPREQQTPSKAGGAAPGAAPARE
ncbi:MAG TPA: efflux RND transporter periplasmic adaptor subunit [Opitutaceae bacterium]|jgi:multidrug efflux system membrane fusion protein